MPAKKPMADQQRTVFPMSTGKSRTGTTGQDYVDKLPEGITDEDIKAKYGKVVWCKFYACKFNTVVEGLQRTTGTLRNNPDFNPITVKDHIWKGICIKDEIAIDFSTVDSGKVKTKVPSCYMSSTDSRQHMDWAKMLQSDGTPYGGSIESRTFEHDWDKHGNWEE